MYDSPGRSTYNASGFGEPAVEVPGMMDSTFGSTRFGLSASTQSLGTPSLSPIAVTQRVEAHLERRRMNASAQSLTPMASTVGSRTSVGFSSTRLSPHTRTPSRRKGGGGGLHPDLLKSPLAAVHSYPSGKKGGRISSQWSTTAGASPVSGQAAASLALSASGGVRNSWARPGKAEYVRLSKRYATSTSI